MDKIKILIADDYHLFIRGMESILSEDASLQIVGKAYNGKQAYEMAVERKPDVILLDMNMPIMNGLQSLKMIVGELKDVKVLMLTLNDREELLVEALKSGAKGYLLKDLLPNELLTFVHMVHRGENIITGQLAGKIIENSSKRAINGKNQVEFIFTKKDVLTKREKEILFHVMKGQTNREIGQALLISENTVKNHLRNIMEKLHMNNRVQAAAYAFQEGWLQKGS
ncbi:response regulator transcription factor [Bacillus salipaludis]|uniref:Response regulator transcription factor n=1 Tax=Bacillus salipaludis TaxID=2547811 RepID=A0A4R5VPA0_9BACI|nr:response regulator transcription factor [Bacillus salipaludis]MDQ6599617.1 response regulator transcription factor [Bacillus salipaludis]TDK60115.1 response regulator transcription factor [Bacillus salipaludis]